MIKAYKKLAIILLLPLTLSGCWDYRDINRKSVDLSIGIDSINNNIKFISEIANVSVAGKNKKIDVYNIISDGPCFEGARADFDRKTSSPDFIGAVRTLVFSKGFAESYGIESYINRMVFNTEFRTSTLIAICDSSIDELFKEKIKSDISTGYAIENTVRYLHEMGKSIYTSALNVQSYISMEKVGYFLPYITRNKDSIQYLGLAAMKDSKLIGVVKAEDSFGELFLLLDNTNINTILPHPKNNNTLISLKAYINKRKIKTTYKNGKIYIDINLKLDSELIYEYSSLEITDDDIKILEENLSQKIKSDLMTALNRSTNIFKCDVFNFARYFRADNAAIYENIDWEKEYLSTIFNLNVNTVIKHTTLIDPNAKLPN